MAAKNILRESIKKLEQNNKLILSRISRTKDKNKINELSNIIARNNSMILDYEYRLKEENNHG
jgi:hypothetical protein